MEWRKSNSSVRPGEYESIGNGRYIIRKDIAETENGYTYLEKIVTEAEANIMQSFSERMIARENEIIEEFVLQLIEEGTL